MGLGDIFKGNQYKKYIIQLQQELSWCQSLLTPELLDVKNRQEIVAKLIADANAIHLQVEQLRTEASNLDTAISKKKETLVNLDDEALYQEFGLYTPRYAFMSVEQYKDKINELRTSQKQK